LKEQDMLPSSETPGGASASNLRRYGPLAVIVVVVVIIGVVVLASRSDDKKPTAATASGSASSSGTTATSGTGAISFSQAKASGRTDLTFPDGCDKTTGRLAIPMLNFLQECYANQPAVTDPGTRGVTNDSVTVVVYIAPDQDAVLDFITSALHINDTGDQVADTYTGYNELFQRFSQTYGRKVNLKFLRASGQSQDAVAARADAVKADEELGAFAVWGGPALTNAWTLELQARGIVCIGCFGIEKPAPNVFNTLPSGEQSRQQLTEYVSKRLNAKPARFAGDPAMQTQNRVFGHLFIETTGGTEKANAADVKKRFTDAGVKLDTQVSYTLDPARLQEQATSVISQLKQAGVTSVIFQGDPIAPATFTREATAQGYFPEWVIGPTVLVDTTAFGRTFDQQQWAHAFGISALPARIDPQKSDSFNLFKWFKGTTPTAIDTAGVLLPNPEIFYAALQAAGPKLTAEAFRQGLFSVEPRSGQLVSQTYSWGNHGFYPSDDYSAVDDYTEIWWDAKAVGADEIRKDGTGMYQYSDGGKRFLPGQWTSDSKAFDPNGAVSIYSSPPPGEVPKDYPSPASGSASSSSSAN
jgi:hypothetical protein